MEDQWIVLVYDGQSDAIGREIDASGGRIRQSFGNQVAIVEGGPEVQRAIQGHAGVYASRGLVPEDRFEGLNTTGQFGVNAWNRRCATEDRPPRPLSGASWGRTPGV